MLEIGSRGRGAGFSCGGDNKFNFGLNESEVLMHRPGGDAVCLVCMVGVEREIAGKIGNQ